MESKEAKHTAKYSVFQDKKKTGGIGGPTYIYIYIYIYIYVHTLYTFTYITYMPYMRAHKPQLKTLAHKVLEEKGAMGATGAL